MITNCADEYGQMYYAEILAILAPISQRSVLNKIHLRSLELFVRADLKSPRCL